MDGYIAKPIHVNELCAEIDAILAAVGGPGGPPYSAAAEEDVVDWAEALKALSGNPKLLKTIVEAALADIPSVMAAISAAVAADDSMQARLAAHNLRGSIRYFGAERAVQLAQIIETMGDEEDLSGAEKLVAVLENEVQRLVAALELRAGKYRIARRAHADWLRRCLPQTAGTISKTNTPGRPWRRGKTRRSCN